MSRVHEILNYAENMFYVYDHVLSADEKREFHSWEAGPEFTRTDEWPGWFRHIGRPPHLLSLRIVTSGQRRRVV